MQGCSVQRAALQCAVSRCSVAALQHCSAATTLLQHVALQRYSIPAIKHAVAALQRSSTAASIAAAQRFSVPFRMQRSALQRCSVQRCSECATSQCAAFQQCSVQQCSVQRCSAEHCSLHCRMQRSALQCAAPQRRVAALQCAACSMQLSVLQRLSAASAYSRPHSDTGRRTGHSMCTHTQHTHTHTHVFYFI